MSTSFLDRVREVCQEVAGRAKLVRIDKDRLPSYAASISDDDLRPSALDPENHYLGHGEATLAYVLTLETINFGSGYFPILRRARKPSGYFMIARKLKNRFEKRGPLTIDELNRFDADDCAKMLGQDRHNPAVRGLMKNYSMSLNELGRHLLERFDGSFTALVESAEGSAEKIAEAMATMSRFDDVAFYGDLDVAFYKRAQLTVAVLSLAAGEDDEWGAIDGLDQLTVFADNQVPHVLRVDGILRYEKELAEHVDAGKLIAPQSAQEVEIRACALHACELVVRELREARREATAMQLDQFLWNRGLKQQYRSLPMHLTRTVFY